jgi:hypothetical protein
MNFIKTALNYTLIVQPQIGKKLPPHHRSSYTGVFSFPVCDDVVFPGRTFVMYLCTLT